MSELDGYLENNDGGEWATPAVTSITVPTGATTDPRVVIGENSLSTAVGYDAAIAFFNDATRGFLAAVDTDGVGGLFSLLASNGLGEVFRVLESQYHEGDPNGSHVTIGGMGGNAFVRVQGDEIVWINGAGGLVVIEAPGAGGLVSLNNAEATDMAVVKISNTQNPTWTGVGSNVYSDLGGANVLSHVFTAPRSGVVTARLMGWGGSNATVINRRTFSSVELREGNVVGAGAIVFAPTDVEAYVYDNAKAVVSINYQYGFHEYVFKGLVPGDQYNIRAMHRISNTGDTGAVFNRHFVIEAMLQGA